MNERRILELSSAAARALTGDANLLYRGRRLHRGARALPLYSAHLHPQVTDDFASHRGAADGFSLRLGLSNESLHTSLKPKDAVERMLFDAFEQFRVEALAPVEWPGVINNLQHRFKAWTQHFFGSRLLETESGLLLFTISQITRASVTNQAILEETEDAMESTRGGILPYVGADLRSMRRERFDQSKYASHALRLAAWVGQRMRTLSENREKQFDRSSTASEAKAFKLLMEWDGDVEQGIRAASTGRSVVLGNEHSQYQVFTKAYDRVSNIAELVRPQELSELRQKLDQRIQAQGVNLPRLARDLLRLLSQPQAVNWRFGQEQGRIDGRRLAQLVSSPNERAVFRDELIEPFADCNLSFLIDCSGSMKQHIETVAMLVDLLSRACEQVGIANEVLGFTTAAWHGGRAQKAWVKAGRPKYPGRLNEVQHLIFKDLQTPWRRARKNIAGLLKSELFREGIDGEAVQWAAARSKSLANHGAASSGGVGPTRRILIVISDACPMDGATQLANDEFYLDNHLKQVVTQLEAVSATMGEVQICALGVGLDLSPYYRHHRSVDFSAPPGNQVFAEILRLIVGNGRSL